MDRIYAGFGARATPADVLELMTRWATYAASGGMVCSTGACLGADQAFANGSILAGGKTRLMLPWTTYEKDWIKWVANRATIRVYSPNVDTAASDSVHQFHPKSHQLKSSVFALHARNYLIVDGVKYAVCWTPKAETVGGSGQAIRICNNMGIPIYNLANPQTYGAFVERLQEEGI